MDNITIKMNETEYPLATTLRVAYKVQGRFGHKPYMEVFKEFDTMKLEDQITILYESFALANPATGITQIEFLGYILDNYGVIELTELVGSVIERIMYGGLTEEELEAKKEKARLKRESL